MRPLLITALLAAAAPQADAGDVSIGFGFRHKGLQIGFKLDRHRQRDQCCERHWVPGYYETVRTRVWVPGHYDRVRDRHGRRGRALGHGHRRHCVYVPGHFEYRYERVWHSGYWEYVCDTPGHKHERRRDRAERRRGRR